MVAVGICRATENGARPEFARRGAVRSAGNRLGAGFTPRARGTVLKGTRPHLASPAVGLPRDHRPCWAEDQGHGFGGALLPALSESRGGHRGRGNRGGGWGRVAWERGASALPGLTSIVLGYRDCRGMTGSSSWAMRGARAMPFAEQAGDRHGPFAQGRALSAGPVALDAGCSWGYLLKGPPPGGFSFAGTRCGKVHGGGAG